MFNLTDDYFSLLTKRAKKSIIRELLKLTEKPDIISFAGGLPDPDYFPYEQLSEISSYVIKERGKTALQYGTTEGDKVLRDELLKLASKDNINAGLDNLIVTVASQQALDLIGKVFIDPGTPILVELPSYLGGLQAFGAYGADMTGIPLDNEGINVDLLEEELKKAKKQGKKYKFLYLIPDFHNPAGVTLTNKRRHKILELSKEYDFLIIEDNPYRDLRFDGEKTDSFYSLAPNENVISLYTFSKILVPGLRLGWVIAAPEIISKINTAKQSSDLCTPPFCQAIAGEFCKRGLLEPHIKNIIKVYKRKRDIMLNALNEFMPKDKNISWTEPNGGLFLWMTLPENINTEELFPKAIDKKVAYIIGSAFYCNGKGQNTLRLNFSFPKEDNIKEGIIRLSEVIKEVV